MVITGGYGVDGDTGESIDMIDTTGGTIILAPDHVVAKVITVTGGNVITGDIADLPTAQDIATEVINNGVLTESKYVGYSMGAQ